MTIKNFYDLRPDEVEPGDVFVCTIAVHVNRRRGNKLLTRAYRCPYPDPELGHDGVPQGDQLDPEVTKALIKGVMPILSWAGAVPE